MILLYYLRGVQNFFGNFLRFFLLKMKHFVSLLRKRKQKPTK